jgi:hypothetical protein
MALDQNHEPADWEKLEHVGDGLLRERVPDLWLAAMPVLIWGRCCGDLSPPGSLPKLASGTSDG